MTPPKDAARADVEAFRKDLDAVRAAIAKRIVGQNAIVDGLLTCVVAGGNTLLEGVPGLGKTMLVRTLADALDCQFSRIQFTPDLMPADIIGTNILVEDETGGRRFQFQQGPVFANLLLADEINRATPKTPSAPPEAMQGGTVSVARDTSQPTKPFLA